MKIIPQSHSSSIVRIVYWLKFLNIGSERIKKIIQNICFDNFHGLIVAKDVASSSIQNSTENKIWIRRQHRGLPVWCPSGDDSLLMSAWAYVARVFLLGLSQSRFSHSAWDYVARFFLLVAVRVLVHRILCTNKQIRNMQYMCIISRICQNMQKQKHAHICKIVLCINMQKKKAQICKPKYA